MSRASEDFLGQIHAMVGQEISDMLNDPDPRQRLNGVNYALKYLKDNGAHRTKSGIMLGLGEEIDEVRQSLYDLREANVDVVTLGQYLQPTSNHLPVNNFVEPDVFKQLEEEALKLGFIHVESGPLVRSSYHAEKHIL